MSKRNANGHDGNGNGHGAAFDAAFARWYQAHYERIKAQCARLLRDEAAAEDIAQEALLRAWVHRAEMRDQDVGAWLTVVARNLCVSSLRRGWRSVPLEPLPEAADHVADPAHEVETLEARRSLRRAFEKLSDRHRRVLYLKEVHGTDYEKLGSDLGLTPEGVRSIAFRARRVLREHLIAVGEGMSGLLLGLRLRVRDLRLRARGALGSLDAAAMPSMQAGMNFALAVGVTLTSLGGLAHAAGPSLRAPTGAVAVAPGGATPPVAKQAGPPTLHRYLVLDEGSLTGGAPGDRSLLPPGTGGKAKPHDENGNTPIVLYVAGNEIYTGLYRGTPDGRPDGYEEYYAKEDALIARACAESNVVCLVTRGVEVGNA